MLAGLPVVGKLLGAEPVGIPLPPIVHRLLEPSLADTVAAHGADKYGPVTHYVGDFWAGLPNHHESWVKAVEAAGPRDAIVGEPTFYA